MKVLVFTNMYPSEELPFYGSFVHDEVRALRAAGIDTDVFFVNGRKSRWNYLGMAPGFFRRVARKPYDIVHVHHSYCGLVATMQSRIPVVWTFHEGEIMTDPATRGRDHRWKSLAYSAGFKRRVARRVDAVIVVAEFLSNPLGRPDAVTLPSAVDTGLFRPCETSESLARIGLDSRRRYILFPSTPGRVEKRYNLARAAVDAVRARCGDYADVELISLDDVPHTEVPMYMNASEMVLMTSAFEASPVTVRESLACNVPVISTDVGDVRQVIDSIEGCHVVEPVVTDIACAIERALNAPRRVAARERMLAYSHEKTAQRIIAVYERLAYSRPKIR